MKPGWTVPSLTALVLTTACAKPEPPLEPAPPTATAPTESAIERIELRADGSIRFRSCAGAITLVYPPVPPTPTPKPDPAVTGHTANAEPTIAAVRPKLKTCYLAALASGHRGQAKVTWRLEIAPNGAVTSAHATHACNAPESFERCLGDALSPLQFEAPGGDGAKLSVPVTFVNAPVRSAPTPIALDGPALQACVKQATTERVGAKASAVFHASGADVKVDPWSGGEALLACAAGVIQRANATFAVELVLGE